MYMSLLFTVVGLQASQCKRIPTRYLECVANLCRVARKEMGLTEPRCPREAFQQVESTCYGIGTINWRDLPCLRSSLDGCGNCSHVPQNDGFLACYFNLDAIRLWWPLPLDSFRSHFVS